MRARIRQNETLGFQHVQRRQHLRSIHLMLGVLGALVTGLILSLSQDGGKAQAQAGPAVHVVRAGLTQQTATAAIVAQDMTNLGGFEFDLATDPAVARFQSAQPGPFLGASGRMTGALGPLIGGQGESLGLGAYSYDPSGQNGPGPNGDGTLAMVMMTVAGEGVTNLALSQPIFVDVEANAQTVAATGAAFQAKSLHPGWNLLAPCVDTSSFGVSATLESLASIYDMVLGERGAYVAGLPNAIQSLEEIAPPWGYYVRITASVPATLTQLAPAFDAAAPIALTAGWRWVGYCPGTTLPITAALQSIDGAYDMVLSETDAYVVGLPEVFQSLRELRQGAGYLIRMAADGVLQYPVGATAVAGTLAPARSTSDSACAHVQATPYSALVYGEVFLDGEPAPVGARVEAVTPRGEAAGCAQVIEPGYFGVMQLYGQDADGRTPGFLPGEPVAWRVDGQETTAAPALVWSGARDVQRIILVTGARPTMPAFLPMIVKGV